MTGKDVIALVAVVGATTLDSNAAAQSYDYSAIVGTNPTYTQPRDINNLDAVVGFSAANQSFMESGGVATSINIPGATLTRTRGINDAGVDVGFLTAPGLSGRRAYVRSGGGVSVFNYAGATSTSGTGINNAGSFVGGYIVGGVQHAFQNIGGVASEITIPGSSFVLATGINDAGDIVGYYQDAGGNYQGFLKRNGVISTIAVPGASTTNPLGINNNGDIVGDYVAIAGDYEQPFALIGNIYTLLDVPLSLAPHPVVDATGINDAGTIVGYSGSADGTMFTGFRATPVAGAPLDIALAGGDALNPVVLPISKTGSVFSAIGGGVTAQFYTFNWSGGAFSATLSLTGADAAMTYTFQLCDGSDCTLARDSAKLQFGDWTGTLADTLDAGFYTIGLIENQPGTDPNFTLRFNRAVSSVVPEPASWALLLGGFGWVGAGMRARRRQQS